MIAFYFFGGRAGALRWLFDGFSSLVACGFLESQIWLFLLFVSPDQSSAFGVVGAQVFLKCTQNTHGYVPSVLGPTAEPRCVCPLQLSSVPQGELVPWVGIVLADVLHGGNGFAIAETQNLCSSRKHPIGELVLLFIRTLYISCILVSFQSTST